MTIKIVRIISVILIISSIFITYLKCRVYISYNINDFERMIILNKPNGLNILSGLFRFHELIGLYNINGIVIKDFYPEEFCNILIGRINNIIKNKGTENWKYSKSKGHDVNIFQVPLSYVLNNITSHEDYLNQDNYGLYDGIISPIQYLKNKLNKNCSLNIKVGWDYELIKYIDGIDKNNTYNKNKILFQEGIVRIYNNNDGGLWHVDVDDSDMYKDYKIYTINIYLQTPEEGNGGRLKIHNKIISPKKGDMIIFDPSYYHCVEKCKGCDNRISIQSFLLYNSKNDYIMIRG